MKVTVSLPERTDGHVTRWARTLGISRSEFFARAAEWWADELDAASLTARIDAAIDAGAVDDPNAWAVASGRRLARGTRREDVDW